MTSVNSFSHEFMVSLASFECSFTQRDVHFVNHGPIYSKIDDKAGYALGWGYCVLDKSFSVSQSSATLKAEQLDSLDRYMQCISFS